MKKLEIPNHESIEGSVIDEWEIYNSTETTDSYVFRLRRMDGHINHAGVEINKEIDEDGYIKVTLMHRTYSNQFYTWKLGLQTLKDKAGFWKNIMFYIEKEHKKYI